LSKVWQLLCPNLETIIEGLAAKLFSCPLEMNSGCHLGFGSSKILSCPLETDSGCYLEFGSKFDLSS
jgi:hypothetical protein